MKRLHNIFFLLCLGGINACIEVNAQQALLSKQPPNFLIINTDDLDFDEIATYSRHRLGSVREMPSHTLAEKAGIPHTNMAGYTLGYTRVEPMITPNIDSLARDGMLFTRYYTTSTVCTPSRFSLLTGKYASRSKLLRDRTLEGEPLVIGFNTPLDGEVSLPKMLQAHGYVTGLVGKWHNFGDPQRSIRGNGQIARLRDADPTVPAVANALREGYQWWVSKLENEGGFDYVGALYPGNVQEIGIPRQLYSERAHHNLEWIVEAAIKFLDKNRDGPFFLYVAPTVPHGWMSDIIGTDEQAVFTPSGLLDAPPKSGMASRKDIRAQSMLAGTGRTMALWLDHAVGALLRRLDDHNLSESTLVIFTSDHGNRGKESVYEGARVPFIVRWPGYIRPGTVSSALVGNIDIAPTVMALAHAVPSSEHQFDGVSLSSVLMEEAESVREYLMLEMSVSRALVTDSFKYVANRPPAEISARMALEADTLNREDRRHGWDANWSKRSPDGLWREAGRINYNNHMFFPAYFDLDQLYDLRVDILEQDNLYGNAGYRNVQETLRHRLAIVLGKTNQQFGEFSEIGFVDERKDEDS